MNERYINVRQFLREASQLSEAPDRHRNVYLGLMALCRKIDVGGRVFNCYSDAWQNMPDQQLLTGNDLLQLATILLKILDSCSRREIKLKLLNSLFKLADILKQQNQDTSQLMQGIEKRLKDTV